MVENCFGCMFTDSTVDEPNENAIKDWDWLNLRDYTSHSEIGICFYTSRIPFTGRIPMIFTFSIVYQCFMQGSFNDPFWGDEPKHNIIWLGWKSCWLSPGDIWQIRTWICLVGNFDVFYHSKSSLNHHLAEYVSNLFQTSYAKLSLGASKFQ